MSAPLTKTIPISKRLKVVTLVSLAVFLFSFTIMYIPQNEAWWFEAANPVLGWLMGGVLASVGLFIFLSGLMLIIMRYDGWISGLAMGFFPFLLIPVALIAFMFIISPPNKWNDEKIYKNGTEYLIYQTNMDGDMQLGRLIKTRSPHGIVRRIWFEKDVNNDGGKFKSNTILYKGKSWVTVR